MCRRFCFVLSLLIVLTTGCRTAYQPGKVLYKNYRITSAQNGLAAVQTLLQPYADSVNKSMNDILAVAAEEMEKRQPEGKLGNLLADAMLVEARRLYKTNVDAAFINYGGVRLTTLPAGNVTRSKVFELAPFDNVMVLQKVSGKTLQQFLDHVSSRGGWPCAGVSFRIQNKKATAVMVGGAPLDEMAVYTIANSDYVANGGDDCTMLKVLPQQNSGYLYRDALINYFISQAALGRQLSSKIENRVTNAE